MSENVLSNLECKNVDKVAEKLHKQFGHPTETKLLKLIHNANIGNDKLVDSVKKNSASCITCCRFKTPSLKPVVSLPMASKFN